MSNRLATRIGLLPRDGAPPPAHDVVRFREPVAGAEARTKGSLFLLAQVAGDESALTRAATDALQALERDYYYDLSAGVPGALSKALRGANRRLFHQRGRLGIPRRGGVSVVAMVILNGEAHVAKLGRASAVICRGGLMYELPPPPEVQEADPRIRETRVADTLGEALEITPFTWSGPLAPGDKIALLSRSLAQAVGNEELQQALTTLRPAAAAEHLDQLARMRDARAGAALLAVEMVEVGPTETVRQLEPVRPAEPLAGLPDRSPVPLADAIARAAHRSADAIDAGQTVLGHGVRRTLNVVLAFVPRRGPDLPRTIGQTELRDEGRRRRRGLVAMAALSALLAVGGLVASLPNPRPTDAIPRAAVARAAIGQATELLGQIGEKVDGRGLIERDPERATKLLNDAFGALARASAAGVPSASLERLQGEVDRGLDTIYAVSRIGEAVTVSDLAGLFSPFEAQDMVVASDGSLWVSETARGRIIRLDPTTGETTVVLRSGQVVGSRTAGEPWMIAAAASDVVVVDRLRQAWRFDLEQRRPRTLELPGIEAISSASHLLAALQHRPPLEIFNLYLVDAASGEVNKWSPANVLPVSYPDMPKPFLTEAADLPPASARDLLVDTNVWLLQQGTVTRVNFGIPLPQSDYAFDPPPDETVRPRLDYRLFDSATIGDRDLFYVYDAANARIIAFQHADGAFVHQWLAPRDGALTGLLDQVVALSVASVADGPPFAYLLTPGQIVRVVLE